MTPASGGGGAGGDLVIPGNPAELAAAAQLYRAAGRAMSEAATQLRGSLGEAADWLGAGAKNHASRVQVLANLHQVAGDALLIGAQGLYTYAAALTQAQQLASQANVASSAAAVTAQQLGSVLGAEATASKTDGSPRALALTGNEGMSSYQTDVARSSQLASTLSDHQGQAAGLGAQAVALADAAATAAAATFGHVAGLATAPTSWWTATDTIDLKAAAFGLTGVPYAKLKDALSNADEAEKEAKAALARAVRREHQTDRMNLRDNKAKVKAAREAAKKNVAEKESQLDEATTDETAARTALAKLGIVGKGLGMTVTDVARGIAARGGESGAESLAADAGDAAGGLSRIGDGIPIAGALLTGALTVNDLREGHTVDAVGDVAGFGASVAVVVLIAPVGLPVLAVVAVAAGVGFAVNEVVDHYGDDIARTAKSVVHDAEPWHW